jgi:hypothetical protein
VKKFSGIYVLAGTIRRVIFEATDAAEALTLATGWNLGLEGEAPAGPDCEGAAAPVPELYDLETSRRLLGGVSRGTIYRWLLIGKLERDPDSRKVLLTRRSIERCGGRN